MAVVAALRAAAGRGPDDLVVVLLPDGGRGYLSKIFSDAWMSDYGFLRAAGSDHGRRRAAGEVGRDAAALVHAHRTRPCARQSTSCVSTAYRRCRSCKAEPPVTAGEVVGSVGEKQLLDALFEGTAALADALERHMSPPLPIIGSGESVTDAVSAPVTALTPLLVHVDGKPAGVITRQDLLGHLRRFGG